MRRKTTNDKVIQITRLDACVEEALLSLQAIRNMKPLARKNVGYKIDMTDNHITITKGIIENLFHDDVGYDGAMCIPQNIIIEVKELEGLITN